MRFSRARNFSLQVLFQTACLLLSVITAVRVHATCSACPPPSLWLSQGGDASNANFNANETLLNWTNVRTATLKWSSSVLQPLSNGQYLSVSRIYSVLASADSALATFSAYIPGQALASDGVEVFNAASGQLRWLWQLGGHLEINGSNVQPAPFTLMHDHVIVNKSNLAGFWSLDPLTGSSVGTGDGGLANVGTEQAPYGGPKSSGALLFYAGSDGGLKAIWNSPPGATLWSVAAIANHPLMNPLAVGDARVYAVMDIFPGSPQWEAHALYAFDAQTGAQLWVRNFPNDTYMSPPSFYGGSVYLKGRTLANVNTLYRIDAATGAVVASTVGGGFSGFTLASLEQALSVGAGVVLVQGISSNVLAPPTLIALDAQSLLKKWESPLSGTTINGWVGAPTIANDFVLACIGVLRVWNVTTGAAGVTSYGNQSCNSQPIVANGRFYYTQPFNADALLSVRGP